MKKNCIVVPVYKEFTALNKDELTSLKQLFKVLGKYDIFFVGPVSLQWNYYINDAAAHNINIRVKNFESFYFESINGYNKLLKSKYFYNSFRNYRYLLIHQTDAFVFRDELQYWCNKGYDYVGAPWFEEWGNARPYNKIIGVGNGGFSLRKVGSIIRILNRINFLKKLRSFWFKSYIQSIIRFEKLILYFRERLKIRDCQNLHDILFEMEINEDRYWAKIIPAIFSDYSIASIEDAIKFCFEVNPSLLFEKNNHQLPFGCHAWQKYEREFWSKYIDVPLLS